MKPPTPLTPEQSHLAADHFKWAMELAGRHARKHRFLDLDFESAAATGLIIAARGFEAERDTQFQTYARPRVIGEMLDEMKRNRVKGYGRHGKAPAILSIASGQQGDESPALSNTLCSEDEPVGWEIQSEDTITRIAGHLPSFHGKVITLTYLHGFTRDKVARTLGVSRPWICQIHDDSLAALRHAIRPMEQSR